MRLIWDAQRFREAESCFLMIADGLEDLPKVKVVAYELVCVELRIEYLFLNLSSLDLLFGH